MAPAIVDSPSALSASCLAMTLQPGDKVYYLHHGKDGTPIKFPAVVLDLAESGVRIRVGRFDVHTQDASTFESVVDEALLEPRSVPCSFEAALTG